MNLMVQALLRFSDSSVSIRFCYIALLAPIDWGFLSYLVFSVVKPSLPNAHALADLIKTCRELNGYANDRFCNSLRKLAENYKTPKPIQIQCIQTYGKLVKPSALAAETLLNFLISRTEPLATAAASGLFELI